MAEGEQVHGQRPAEAGEVPSLAPMERASPPAPAQNLNALEALITEANGETSSGRRREKADRICARLDALGRAGGSAEVAEFLKTQLDLGTLRELSDSEGRTCRAAAVQALLAMGYPHALEISPEDLDHLRQGGATRSSKGALVAGLFVVLALSALEVALAPLGSGGGLLLVHAGLTVGAAIAVALTRPKTNARKLSLAALALAGLEGLALYFVGTQVALWPGVGALAAAILMAFPKRRGDSTP